MDTESRKTGLEMDLSTNFVRRKEELEAVKLSADMLQGDSELKKEELKNAKSLVDRLMEQFKSVEEIIDKCNSKSEEVRIEKDELKSLEDQYQDTQQAEDKKLDPLLDKEQLSSSRETS